MQGGTDAELQANLHPQSLPIQARWDRSELEATEHPGSARQGCTNTKTFEFLPGGLGWMGMGKMDPELAGDTWGGGSLGVPSRQRGGALQTHSTSSAKGHVVAEQCSQGKTAAPF